MREVGALPEDTSREGWAVKVVEKRKAQSRHLGRIGGNQKNQASLVLITLLAAPRAPHFASLYAPGYRLSTILWFSQNRIYVIRRSQSL